MSKKQQKPTQKLSSKQREERIAAAQERERKDKEARDRKAMLKRVGVIVVCVILVLALCLPTVGLSLSEGFPRPVVKEIFHKGGCCPEEVVSRSLSKPFSPLFFFCL